MTPGIPFTDETPVRVTFDTDQGALAALKDNPVTLHGDEPGLYFANAVRRGIRQLDEAEVVTGGYWRVVEQEVSHDKPDTILLGLDADDAYRIGVTFKPDPDGDPEVGVQLVYPCRECRWANTCEEGCHS